MTRERNFVSCAPNGYFRESSSVTVLDTFSRAKHFKVVRTCRNASLSSLWVDRTSTDALWSRISAFGRHQLVLFDTSLVQRVSAFQTVTMSACRPIHMHMYTEVAVGDLCLESKE